MNFLALCRRGARECGMTASTTIPTAVTSQTGELARLVDWIASAWDEIQGKYENWRWMRSRFTVNTSSGDDTYAGTDCTDERLSATVSRFARWWVLDEHGYSNVKIYKQSDGVGTERYLPFLPWANFRAIYKIGTQNNGTPAHCTIDPQNNLVIGPKPDGIYVVSGEYQMSKQTLDDDADTPEMPERFHLLIVYEAMKKAGGFDAANEVYARGESEGKTLWRQLEADQLPDLVLAGPLV